MKTMRKGWLLVAIILMIGAVSGCNVVKVNPEKDREQVLAEVNGDTILKGEVLDRYEMEKAYYYISNEMEEDPEQEEYILEVKKMVLDSIITEKILLQKAEAAGFKMTEELKDEAREELQDQLKAIEDSLKAQDEAGEDGGDAGESTETESGEDGDDGGTGENEAEENGNVDYAQQAREYLDSQLEAMGMTEDEFIELVAQQKQISQFYDETLKDVKATQEDMQQFYDDELAKQKEDRNYTDTSAQVVLHQPDRIRVKHILIKLPDDQIEEYNQLLKEAGDDEEKKKDAEDYLNEKLEAIKPEAQDVLDRARDGEEFESLIEEKSGDEGMDIDEGYVIHKDTSFIQEFKDAAFKLQEDEISELVAGSYGYHIIKLYEKLPEETFALEEKQEEIQEIVESNLKNEEWQGMIENWKKSVKKYENRL